MRTDAVFIAPQAQAMAADFIAQNYGETYLPSERPAYKSKAGAQEAHEAIRPSDATLRPEDFPQEGQAATLYGLIWRRFVASQMAAGVDTRQIITILAGKQDGKPYPLKLEAHATTPQFDGFRRVYQVGSDVEDDTAEEDTAMLPPLQKG